MAELTAFSISSIPLNEPRTKKLITQRWDSAGREGPHRKVFGKRPFWEQTIFLVQRLHSMWAAPPTASPTCTLLCQAMPAQHRASHCFLTHTKSTFATNNSTPKPWYYNTPRAQCTHHTHLLFAPHLSDGSALLLEGEKWLGGGGGGVKGEKGFQINQFLPSQQKYLRWEMLFSCGDSKPF